MNGLVGTALQRDQGGVKLRLETGDIYTIWRTPREYVGKGGAPPTQRYYRGHTSAVLSVAMHPQGTVFASGALATDPQIHVWDESKLMPLAVLRGAHTAGNSLLNTRGTTSITNTYSAWTKNASSTAAGRSSYPAALRRGRQWSEE